jgi:hypothetical protein
MKKLYIITLCLMASIILSSTTTNAGAFQACFRIYNKTNSHWNVNNNGMKLVFQSPVDYFDTEVKPNNTKTAKYFGGMQVQDFISCTFVRRDKWQCGDVDLCGKGIPAPEQKLILAKNDPNRGKVDYYVKLTVPHSNMIRMHQTSEVLPKLNSLFFLLCCAVNLHFS